MAHFLFNMGNDFLITDIGKGQGFIINSYIQNATVVPPVKGPL